MTTTERFLQIGEWLAAGLYEVEDRGQFYRRSLGLKRFYEHVGLPEYTGTPLYPSGPKYRTSMIVAANYNKGVWYNYKRLAEKDQELADLIRKDFFGLVSYVPAGHDVAGNMWTHSSPNYERILHEGLDSYVERILKIEDKDIKDGLMLVMDGIRCYHARCVGYLEGKGADAKLIEALKKVPFSPAETLYEALVCWNFIMYIDGCDNLGSLASGIEPWFNGEDIVDILANLYDNLDVNEGWTMALNCSNTELTVQCLKAAHGKRRPMIELFVGEDTPQEVWEAALNLTRTSGGQPAFYNRDYFLNGLKQRFPEITDKDLEKFCGGGCAESMIAGCSCVGSLDAGVNLPLILVESIHEDLAKASSFEEFYNAYMDRVAKVVERVAEGISKTQKLRSEIQPHPMRTLLIDDCIDNGKDYFNGGARYKWSDVNFAGMINVIDSMLVIRDLVFKDKKYSAEEMISLLDNNDEAFLEEVKNYPVCFGNDSEEVNEFSHSLSEQIYAMFGNYKPYIGSGFLPSAIQFNTAAVAGYRVGATPDGRKSGSPLCDSLTAIFSKDKKGPTALLKSIASLDLKGALGTPIVNFTISPQFDNETFKNLIMGYMALGGIQLQITCTSREMLLEAYNNPEAHKNLVIRVGGYSEYFHRLTEDLKKMVIKRTVYL